MKIINFDLKKLNEKIEKIKKMFVNQTLKDDIEKN